MLFADDKTLALGKNKIDLRLFALFVIDEWLCSGLNNEKNSWNFVLSQEIKCLFVWFSLTSGYFWKHNFCLNLCFIFFLYSRVLRFSILDIEFDSMKNSISFHSDDVYYFNESNPCFKKRFWRCRARISAKRYECHCSYSYCFQNCFHPNSRETYQSFGRRYEKSSIQL